MQPTFRPIPFFKKTAAPATVQQVKRPVAIDPQLLKKIAGGLTDLGPELPKGGW